MARLARWRTRGRGSGTRELLAGGARHGGAAPRSACAVFCEHAVPEHDSAISGGAASGRPRNRAPDPVADPVERGGDRHQGEQGVLRDRRTHRELPVGGNAIRRGLHAFLARSDGKARWRSRLLPGPLLARLLRSRVSRRPADRGAAAELPPGGGRERHLLLPASLAHAGFLAVPDRVDGPRAADVDLSGAVPEIPASSRPRRHQRTARSGPSSAMARRTSRRASARSPSPRARTARQSDLCHQLQPAASRRAGARQRQDHPGAGGQLSAAPAGTSSR